MKIVGHKSEKIWKRYNSIEESDLVNAARKLNTYLQTNTVLTQYPRKQLDSDDLNEDDLQIGFA